MPFRRGQLRYFVTVAEEGQITRAAKKLHIAQPALSQAIAQLEADLGLTLFERHARGVTLTAPGERFYDKARLAVASMADAVEIAKSLQRSEEGTVEFGFLGSPPGYDSPRALELFARTHPHIDIHYRELAFPSVSTSSWISQVDLAVCHQPAADSEVWSHTLRREPRTLLAPKGHRLAGRRELTVEEILEETFIGMHPSVEPGWAGFWSLDDHRGCSPAHVTADTAGNPQEVLAALAVRSAVTSVPESVSRVVVRLLTDLAAIPIRDAEPSTIVLLGHQDHRNTLVTELLEFARENSDGGSRATREETAEVR